MTPADIVLKRHDDQEEKWAAENNVFDEGGQNFGDSLNFA